MEIRHQIELIKWKFWWCSWSWNSSHIIFQKRGSKRIYRSFQLVHISTKEVISILTFTRTFVFKCFMWGWWKGNCEATYKEMLEDAAVKAWSGWRMRWRFTAWLLPRARPRLVLETWPDWPLAGVLGPASLHLYISWPRSLPHPAPELHEPQIDIRVCTNTMLRTIWNSNEKGCQGAQCTLTLCSFFPQWIFLRIVRIYSWGYEMMLYWSFTTGHYKYLSSG